MTAIGTLGEATGWHGVAWPAGQQRPLLFRVIDPIKGLLEPYGLSVAECIGKVKEIPRAKSNGPAPTISSNFSNFSNFSDASRINSENALSPADPWLDPQPLRRELPPPEPFPTDALGDKIASAVREVQRIVKAPEALCGSEFLAAAALTVQPRADIVLDGRVVPLVLFFLILGVSGERKSAIDKIALSSVAYQQRALRQQYDTALADFELELAAWKKATE